MEAPVTEQVFENLREDDVRIIIRHPDPELRAQAVRRVCTAIKTAPLSKAEKIFARKLLNYMSEDAVAMVRRALAVTLRNSHELPRDVALKLAADIDNIAIPVLENSPVFSDADLIEILRSKAAAKIVAVAKRPVVSGNVVRAIVRYGDSKAVAEVAANDGALIDADTAGQILDAYQDDDLIKAAFISRRDLPLPVMEKLITVVSEEAALLLNRRHDVPIELAIDLASRARERATVSLSDFDMAERDLERLVRRLHEEARLTVSLIIRAAGLGRMSFVVHALSMRSGVGTGKASAMVHDTGPFGLPALCAKAGLSDEQAKILRAACTIYRDLEASGLEYDAAYFQSLMVERMMTLPYDLPKDDMQWFLERLDGIEDRAA